MKIEINLTPKELIDILSSQQTKIDQIIPSPPIIKNNRWMGKTIICKFNHTIEGFTFTKGDIFQCVGEATSGNSIRVYAFGMCVTTVKEYFDLYI